LKALLIFNPQAGNGRAKKILGKVEKLLRDKGITPDIKLTEKKGHGTELVKSADISEYDAILTAGGDGTLFETLNGLFLNPNKKKPPLGIIPIGTGNAFVRDMDLRTGEFEKAVEIIAKGKKKKVDVGKFETENKIYHFLNIVGLGFVSDVAELAHKLKIFGNFSYTLAIFAKLISLKSFPAKIEFDGKTIERNCVFIEISNSRYTSNFLMAPNAEVDDGYFDITILNKTSRTKLIKAFPKIFTGEHIHIPEVETFKARNISVITEENKVLTPDGEILGTSPFKIECLHKAIEVFWQ